MFAGQRVRVTKLDRHTEEDRSAFVGQDGAVVHRVNVAWTPDAGGLWKVRFGSGGEAVFAESEIVLLDREGEPAGSEIEEVKEAWGKAPRTVSMPFKRRFE